MMKFDDTTLVESAVAELIIRAAFKKKIEHPDVTIPEVEAAINDCIKNEDDKELIDFSYELLKDIRNTRNNAESPYWYWEYCLEEEIPLQTITWISHVIGCWSKYYEGYDYLFVNGTHPDWV